MTICSLRMVKIKVAQQGSSLVLGEPARRADSNGTIGLPWQAVLKELAPAKVLISANFHF